MCLHRRRRVGPEKLALGPWFVEDTNQNGGKLFLGRVNVPASPKACRPGKVGPWPMVRGGHEPERSIPMCMHRRRRVGPKKLALGPWFVEDTNQNGGMEILQHNQSKIAGEPVNVF
jgi:hypothetical protein